jgi:hypothetical protein
MTASLPQYAINSHPKVMHEVEPLGWLDLTSSLSASDDSGVSSEPRADFTIMPLRQHATERCKAESSLLPSRSITLS